MKTLQMDNPVVLFDGVCNLCNGLVQFILNHEKSPNLKFAALQSEAGIKLLKKYSINSQTSSIIVIENGTVYAKSEAVFKIAKSLGSPWSFIGIFAILPRMINDFFYDMVAKYRYRIFGRTEFCKLPDENNSSRFLQ